jgi:DNA polymerase-1
MVARPSQLPEAGANDVLFLIDLSNYVFRAYHALPQLSNSRGEPTSATLGTLNMLNRLVEDHRPAYLAVVMDSRGRGFRGEIDPRYKANRPGAPPELVRQLERCREIFEAYRVPIYSVPGYEADDLIATLARQAVAAGLRVVIASSDKDLLQLVRDGRVVCWDAMRGSVYGPPEVEKKYGVSPGKMRELLALVGDSSDNITGVPGVGPKTAAKLLGDFGSIEGIFAQIDSIQRPKLRASLEAARDDVARAYQLVELRDDAKLELDLAELRYGNADVDKLRELFTELQFPRFLEMLDEGAMAVPEPEPEGSAQLVLEVAELERIAERAREEKRLAITVFGPLADPMRTPITGIALATDTRDAAYLPLGHRYLGAPKQLDLETVRRVLGPVLADPAIAKIGHDLKLSAVMLAHHGMPLEGVSFDSMLASYLIDPESTHKLGLIAERDAKMKWTEFEALTPKTKKGPKPTIEEIETDRAAPWGCAHALAPMRLSERYLARLERDGLRKLYDDLELPLLKVLTQMELTGVLLDPAPLARLGEQMTAELGALEKKAHEIAGHEFNLASPKQLESVLFDELGLKSIRKTKTGRSTDADALEAIAEDHPLPAVLIEHRATAKLFGTYVEALPRLINPDTGRIHGRWEQAVAATGRLSSKDPNLQNIPIRSEHGKRIRDAFVAPEGMLILSADYSQIELRIMAHLSRDERLVEAFQSGQDVHVRTAMEVFGVSADEVTPRMRSQCKTVNFGVIYGMGPIALAKELGISKNDAKGFIDRYFERYSGVRTFMDDTLAHARQSRMVRTLLGRRRMLADLSSSNHARRSYAERIAGNTPIQGTAADLLKLAMVKLAEPLVPGARMVLTVHDELVFEVPAAHVEEAAERARRIMESVYRLEVPLVVDVGWGRHWGEAH